VTDLSVVIPVYNEEESLPPLWAELREVLDRLGLAFEVVFVDDGSRDRSAEIVRSFREADPRVRLVRLKANGGETAATDIPTLLSHLDHWDAATGWRVTRSEGDNVVRRASSRIANHIRNWVTGETVQDSGCTFRAFRRDCLRGLVLYHGFHRFIPTLLKMRGYRVVEVPVSHRPRRFGRTTYGVLNRAFVAFADLMVVRWMNARLLRYEVVEDVGGDLMRD